MKRLLVALVVLVVILVAVGIFALSQANSLVNKYKPELEKAASSAVGAKVTLGDLHAQVLPQVRIKIGSLKLASADNSAEAGLQVKEALLNLKLLPLVRGELEISKISFLAPKVLLVKDANGVRVAGMTAQPKSETPANPASSNGSNAKPASAPSSPLRINLERFEISEGEVRFRDQVAGKEYTLNKLELSSKLDMSGKTVTLENLDFSAQAMNKLPVTLQIPKLAFDFSKVDAPEIKLGFLGNTIEAAAALNLRQLLGQIKVSSGGIALDSLKPALDMFAPTLKIELSGKIKPDLTLKLVETSLEPQVNGKIELSGIAVKQPQVAVKNLGGTLNLASSAGVTKVQSSAVNFEVNDAPLKLALAAECSKKAVTLNDISLNGFGGVTKVNAKMSLSGTQEFNSALSVSGVDLAQVFGALKPELAAKLNGTVKQAQANISGNLSAGETPLTQTLSGPVNVKIVDGALKGVNIVGLVLSAAQNLPFVSGRLYDSATPQQRAELERQDTVIKELSADLTLGAGRINIRSLNLQSALFALDANGSLGFDSSLNLAATMALEKDLSANLARDNKDLKYAFDQEGRIIIPVVLQGTPPKVAVLPNFNKLLQTAGGRKLEEKAGQALQRLFGGRR